jgi:hypothetical protein
MRIRLTMTTIALMAWPAVAQGQMEASARGSASAQAEVTRESERASGNAALESHTNLRIAREALTRRDPEQRQPSQREIAAGADAIAEGATRVDLVTVRDAAPPERNLTASLEALARLRARGMGGAQAASAIAARLEAGASDRAIASFVSSARSTADLSVAGTGSATGALDAAAGVGGALDGAAGVGGALGGVGGSLSGGVGVVGSLGGILR